jgi:hypothetical protein
MALWQTGDIPDTCYLELLGTSHALQCFETFERNLAAAGHELEETPDVLFSSGGEGLPQPAHLRTFWRVPISELSIGAQIRNYNKLRRGSTYGRS